MPWYSWSTPAEKCHTGSKLRKIKGSVCSKCYACKGFYPFPAPKAAMERRFATLDDPRWAEAFVVVLTEKYKRTRKTRRLRNGRRIKENRFRWHDSGDLQSEEHFGNIVTIAERCPFIEFYLPTKEAGYVGAFLKKGGKIPKNLHVKISHPMIGGTFDKPPMGLSFSTVGRDDDPAMFQCPAPKQGGKCLDCDRCWTEAKVNYHVH